MLAPPRAAECVQGLPMEIGLNIYFLRDAPNLAEIMVKLFSCFTCRVYSPHDSVTAKPFELIAVKKGLVASMGCVYKRGFVINQEVLLNPHGIRAETPDHPIFCITFVEVYVLTLEALHAVLDPEPWAPEVATPHSMQSTIIWVNLVPPFPHVVGLAAEADARGSLTAL